MITEKRLRLLMVFLALVMSACARSDSPDAAAILLFNGHGTSPNDVTAIERILRERRLTYATADSRQLDAMSESQLKSYRLMIVPGGNFVEFGNGVTTGTTSRLRAVVESGVNYLGICGGAFFAGNSPYNGLNLTSGVRFKFYSAEERGIRKTAVAVTPAGSVAVDHYWEDGPELSGWGEVVAKYPDGTPAVVQGTFGDGWIVLTGVHPEAPDTWRTGMAFTSPATVANAYAATLIDAALNRTRLAHY
jgi:glutamine amidotransferase-like uncharacterized protein